MSESSSALFAKLFPTTAPSAPSSPESSLRPAVGESRDQASRNIDPVAAAENISQDYRRYLKTMLSPSDGRIAEEFNRAVDEAPNLTQGPILQLTPPYAPGSTAGELIDEQVLCPSFSRLDNAFPLDRPLYRHQEKALRKVKQGRNLIVSTGTGSGKTESFLIPIIDELLSQQEQGTLGPGVRALLLYPMNALANDQVKRLRELLVDTPEITFGRYTGETEPSRSKAEERYRQINGQHAVPLPNELISREEMQENPPHLLLTNYAMLEYLLLRPRDNAFFDDEFANEWKFIVIDEAHVYAGAQGTEVGMLLRRLKDRVQREQPLQCIATSASLEGQPENIMRFGTDLFGEPFEFIDDDPERQDLVRAEKRTLPASSTWSLPDELFDAPIGDGALLEQLQAQDGDDYENLSREQHIVRLRELSAERSRPLQQIGAQLWPAVDSVTAMHRAHMLVLLGSSVLSGDDIPALSARYHMFVRAAEGAFLGFREDGRPVVSLDRHVTLNDTERPVYEMGTCSKCGTVHINGIIDKDTLVPPDSSGNPKKPKWVVLSEDTATALADEDEFSSTSEESPADVPLNKLCTACGRLSGSSARTCPDPDCGGVHLLGVKVLPSATGKQEKCISCGGRSANLIRRLLPDVNAAPAVLMTSLFQMLPEAADEDTARKIGAGRKLLAFSDSRQAAAYAAPYLEATYGGLLERRILVSTLEDPEFSEGAPLERWIRRAGDLAKDERVLSDRLSSRQILENTGTWVFADLASTTRRLSTEGLALAKVELTASALSSLECYRSLAELLGSEETAGSFLNVLAQDIRHKGAVTFPDYVNMSDSRFEPRLGQHFFRPDGGTDSARRLYSWIPQKGTNNRRGLITKVLRHIGVTEEEHITRLLKLIWTDLTRSEILVIPGQKAHGFALNYKKLQVSPGAHHSWYQCDRCRNITAFNISELCPHGFCAGTLQPIEQADIAEHHYRSLAENMEVIPLRAREHTAQWTPAEAAEVQKEFVNGDVNVLSCSTTFELGVDVGDLQSVMLRNVPPRTANYVQRAGRAGRRSGSAAFVLTFARRAAHDMAVFRDPVTMIDGEMTAPFLHIENHRIAMRHVYSIALAAFFREQAGRDAQWSTAGGFLLGDCVRPFIRRYSDAPAARDELVDFLTPVPPEVAAALKRVFPPALHEQLGLDGSWTANYLELFDEVRADIKEDFSILSKLQQNALAAGEGRRADAFKFTISSLVDQDLLGYLAKKNLLPKYSFPVDTVELQTNFNEEGNKINLSRDLQLAISDYAPGAQVVAGGKVWESAGIRLLPGKKIATRYWAECRICGHTETNLEEFHPGATCSQCSSPLDVSRSKKFIIPIYGFIARHTTSPVGTAPPTRSWNRREFVQKFGERLGKETFQNADATVLTQSWTRTEMGALETGSNYNGFRYCSSCGFATPANKRPEKIHKNPRSLRECSGFIDYYSLGHNYQTDITTVSVPSFPGVDFRDWRSGMYALIEAASETLEINRDDLNGTMAWQENVPTMVFFDTVPGGAGITRKVRERFPAVLDAALSRVSDCSCGLDTSCYACLRSYSNQHFHRELRRDSAIELLEHMKLAVG